MHFKIKISIPFELKTPLSFYNGITDAASGTRFHVPDHGPRIVIVLTFFVAVPMNISLFFNETNAEKYLMTIVDE